MEPTTLRLQVSRSYWFSNAGCNMYNVDLSRSIYIILDQKAYYKAKYIVDLIWISWFYVGTLTIGDKHTSSPSVLRSYSANSWNGINMYSRGKCCTKYHYFYNPVSLLTARLYCSGGKRPECVIIHQISVSKDDNPS